MSALHPVERCAQERSGDDGSHYGKPLTVGYGRRALTGMAAEDDIDKVVHARFFRGQPHGVMVEVGAARPDYLSIGAHYRAIGRRVISIEPNPTFCAEHRAAGNEIIECAASDVDAHNVPFYIAD
jgi:hypothetical protein